ncbi:MAG: exodeoxyribonuclease V subunit beta [Spirochaetes bacterium]|nr:exodeoxyribonuclease V subunit beta [Spirochaetota bacterium]
MKPFDLLQLPLKGCQLIEASAGTGKTFSIAHLYIRLLLEAKLKVNEILVVTFTEAATAELKSRIIELIQKGIAIIEDTAKKNDSILEKIIHQFEQHDQVKDLLYQGLYNFDKAEISTIHAFCKKILIRNAFESYQPFDLDFTADLTDYQFEAFFNFWHENFGQTHPIIGLFLNQLDFNELLAVTIKGMQHFNAQIYPRMSEITPIKHFKPLIDVFYQCQKSWKDNKEAVKEALLSRFDNNQISKTYYRTKKSLQTDLDFLEYFFEQKDLLYPFDYKIVRNFSTDRLIKIVLKKGLPIENPFFQDIDHLLQVIHYWQNLIKQQACSKLNIELTRLKSKANVLSFDDLLLKTHYIITHQKDSTLVKNNQEQYKAALIDEFQDTDLIQFEIFKVLFSKKEQGLFLIGDPKQSIYGFRNADIFTYFQAEKTYSASKFSMNRNYRSDPLFLKGLNILFSQNSHPFIFSNDKIAYHPVDAHEDSEEKKIFNHKLNTICNPIKFISIEDKEGQKGISKTIADQEIPKIIANDVYRVLTNCHWKISNHSTDQQNTQKICPSDIAVLVRTNQQALNIKTELDNLGIPAVAYDRRKILTTAEAFELFTIIKGINEPERNSLVISALATRILDFHTIKLQALLNSEKNMNDMVEKFIYWKNLWQSRGFMSVYEDIIEYGKVLTRWLAQTDGERKVTNLNHLGEIINQLWTQKQYSISDILDWYEQHINLENEEHELRLESDAEAVNIVTIYKSKGLEYSIVYCPYLWEARSAVRGPYNQYQPLISWHDSLDQDQLKIHFTSDSIEPHIEDQSEKERLAEDLRLLYVAITRAKYHCTLVLGSIKNQMVSALNYLLLFKQRGDKGNYLTYSQINDWLKKQSFQDVKHLLCNLKHQYEDIFSIQEMDFPFKKESIVYQFEKEWGNLTLKNSDFKRKLNNLHQMSSYSRLTSQLKSEQQTLRDTDGEIEEDISFENNEISLPESDIHLRDFPPGALVGNFIHQLLEELPFHLDYSKEEHHQLLVEKIEKYLVQYGFQDIKEDDKNSLLIEQAKKCFLTVISSPLVYQDKVFCLKNLDQHRVIKEMNFIFPVRKENSLFLDPLVAQDLVSVLEKYQVFQQNYLDELKALDFAPLIGFLRGMIDLVFQYENRFFIIDYKSNYIGNLKKDYQTENIATVMEHHHYHLQLLIYNTAIYRYLNRFPKFQYQKHFGGAYYLFLRGMDKKLPVGHSIYYYRYSGELIEHLSDMIQ